MKKSILIIVILAFFGAGAYLFFRQPSVNSPSGNKKNDELVDLTDWKKYQSNIYGFEIMYSPQYLHNEGASQNYNVGEFFVGNGENIVTISLPKTFYPGTNYFQGFLTVSAQPQGLQSSCKLAQRDGDTDIISLIPYKKLSGLEFFSGETNGAAAGTFVINRIYHAFTNNTCYEVTLNLFEGNIGNYPQGTVSQVDEIDVFSRLEAVMATFKIIGTPLKKLSTSEQTPEQFLKNYLDAYKDIAVKKNFIEVKSFLTKDALDFMQSENIPLETNYTQYDSYQILSIENAGSHYVAKVKLYSGGQVLKKPDASEITEIDVIKQGGQFKSETWYFMQ